MSEFTANGITIDRLDDVLEKIFAELKSYFGDNIKTDAQSNLGAFNTIYAEAIADQNELIESVVSAFQAAKATGVFLSELVKLNGITRNEAENSSVVLDLTANTAGCTVTAGSLVSDPVTNIQFAVDSDTIVPASTTVQASATAIDVGPIVAEADTLTKIDTPIYGWESVNNPSDAIVGYNEESDTELRARRDIAASVKSASGVRGIYTAIADLQEVVDTYVHDNKGSTTDAYGVGPGQIWCIVEGGADADIAEAIFSRAPAGHGFFGAVTFPLADTVTGQTYDIKFSRPTEKDIYISVDLSVDSSYPGDGDDQIEQALLNYFDANQKLGKDVIHSRLYTPINTVPGHTVNSLYIGFLSASGSADLAIAINEKAVTDSTKITITK